MIILKILWAHIVFSLFITIFYEILKNYYGQQIIANGWGRTKECQNYEKKAAVDPEYKRKVDIVFWLVMFIPIINIDVTRDLINMIRYTPEEMKREGIKSPME